MARHDQRRTVILCLACGKKDHDNCLNKDSRISRLCDCTCVPKEPEYRG